MLIHTLFDTRGVGGIVLAAMLLLFACLYAGIRRWIMTGAMVHGRIGR